MQIGCTYLPLQTRRQKCNSHSVNERHPAKPKLGPRIASEPLNLSNGARDLVNHAVEDVQVEKIGQDLPVGWLATTPMSANSPQHEITTSGQDWQDMLNDFDTLSDTRDDLPDHEPTGDDLSMSLLSPAIGMYEIS
jgi:hypothetical protein